jgi:hypothetical protein
MKMNLLAVISTLSLISLTCFAKEDCPTIAKKAAAGVYIARTKEGLRNQKAEILSSAVGKESSTYEVQTTSLLCNGPCDGYSIYKVTIDTRFGVCVPNSVELTYSD